MCGPNPGLCRVDGPARGAWTADLLEVTDPAPGGWMTAIRIPTEREEAVRDLCRARVDMVTDRHRARRRLLSFLLRHGHVYRQGSAWTATHERWLSSLRFADPALTSTFHHYRAVIASRDVERRARAGPEAGRVRGTVR